MALGERRALVVATENYDDKHFDQLRTPARDAEAVARVLGNPKLGGFSVLVLKDEPSYLVNQEIESLFRSASRHDLILVYIACHGLKDKTGQLYFITVNTRYDRPTSTSVPAIQLLGHAQQSACKRTMLVLDCCFSGAFGKGARSRAALHESLIPELMGKGRVVLTACDEFEYAFEEDDLVQKSPRLSYFTSAFVEGLEGGQAARPGFDVITVDDLYDYVWDKVRTERPEQTPTKWVDHGLGRLVVARNPRTAESAHLRNLPTGPLPAAPMSGLTTLLAESGDLLLVDRLLDDGELPQAQRILKRLATHDDPSIATGAWFRQAAIAFEENDLESSIELYQLAAKKGQGALRRQAETALHVVMDQRRVPVTWADFEGEFSGSYDGRPARLTIKMVRAAAQGGSFDIVFHDVVREEIYRCRHNQRFSAGAQLTLQNLWFRRDDNDNFLVWPSLHLHRHNGNYLSGVSRWEHMDALVEWHRYYGICLCRQDVHSKFSLLRPLLGSRFQSIDDWPGQYKGLLDGRPARMIITLEEVLQEPEFMIQFEDLMWGRRWTKRLSYFDFNHPDEQRNITGGSTYFTPAGEYQGLAWRHLFMHTFDIDFITGFWATPGREHPALFQRETESERVHD